MSGIAKGVFVDVKRKAEAAAHDEQITRRRVEACEHALEAWTAVLSRPFLGRLRWLFLGR